MKLTFLFLTVAFLNVHATGVSQNITFSGDKVPLRQVLKAVERQTKFVFIVDAKLLANAEPVSVKAENQPLEAFLTTALKGQSLDYTIENKTIVISRRRLVYYNITDSGTIQKIQLIEVSGVVTDTSGIALAGASVSVKKGKASVVTDQFGHFSLQAEPGQTIVISYVGFENREFKVTTAGSIGTLTLKRVNVELSGVAVYNDGFQTLSKERATGSFSKVDNELLNRKVTPNIMDRIYEVTSGVVNNRNQQAGLQVRGTSTINGPKSPLIILDNFPFNGNTSNINPNDVESITVLKDAAASSIWGAQAGNGVIVIVTKKGGFNKRPAISFNSNVTVAAKPDLDYIPLIQGKDEIAYEKMRFANGEYNKADDVDALSKRFTPLPQVAELLLAVRRGQITQAQADAQIAKYEQHDVRDDLKKYFMRTPVNQQYAMNISGGNNNYNYYASIGYDKQLSINPGDKNDRITINFNNTWRPFRNAEVNGFIAYNQTKFTSTSNAPYSFLLPIGNGVATPYAMLADENGNALAIPRGQRSAYMDTVKSGGALDWKYRPLDELNARDYVARTFDTRVGFNAKYTIIPGLAAEVKYQFQRILTDNRELQPLASWSTRDRINQLSYTDPVTKQPVFPLPVGGILTQSNNALRYWNVRTQLSFNRTFNTRHEVSAIAGTELGQTNADSRGNTIYGFSPDVYTFAPINPTVNYSTRFGGTTRIADGNSVGSTISRKGSYFANASYTLDGKYSISGSGRVDQSNFYGIKANQRFVPLWSAGAAWEISRELFYRVSWLPYLKARATYGYSGNTGGGVAYPIATYSNGNIASSGLPTATVYPGNPELRWEKVGITNFAIDAATPNRRIAMTVEYYMKNAVDLIGPLTLDPTSGYFSLTGNKASLKGKGIDLTISSRNLVGAFKWNTNFLFNWNTDKITAFNQKITTGSQMTVETAPVIGQPLYKMYSYQFAGLDHNTGDPLLYIGGKAVSYTQMYNAKPEDMVYAGTTTPRFFGSMMNTFSYKGISLSANIVYKMKWVFRRSTINYSSLQNNWGGHADYYQRWQKPGDELTTTVPSLPMLNGVTSFRGDHYSMSDVLVEKGDFIRLQDIRIGYDFNRGLLTPLHIQSATFYVYMNNIGLLYRANDKGLDPEAYSFGSMPEPRSIAVGLNVNF